MFKQFCAVVAVASASAPCLGQTAYCWGNNGSGQRNVPADLGPVSQIACGINNTVALKLDGSIRCWGSNGSGQLNIPANLGPVRSLANNGGDHTAVIKIDGTIVCWGSNTSGQCNVPSNLGVIKQASTGHSHTIAVNASGSIACWGANQYGQCTTPTGLNSVLQVGWHIELPISITSPHRDRSSDLERNKVVSTRGDCLHIGNASRCPWTVTPLHDSTVRLDSEVGVPKC